MNCFVIMPFAPEYDDVHMTIKASVQNALGIEKCRCFRLDESRPAGRITPRLLQELNASSFCIADLSGLRPNVMWELGYVMALDRPTILLTQTTKGLPFDLTDMQCIHYDRNRLGDSLGKPLEKMVIDTVSSRKQFLIAPKDGQELVGHLIAEVASLKAMVSEAVILNKPGGLDGTANTGALHSLRNLQGSWINRSGDTHIYAKLIHNDLIAPYCYCGNDNLDSVYFGWRFTGVHWFARFQWFETAISGFSFLQQTSVNTLTGAWWGGTFYQEETPPKKAEFPPFGSGPT